MIFVASRTRGRAAIVPAWFVCFVVEVTVLELVKIKDVREAYTVRGIGVLDNEVLDFRSRRLVFLCQIQNSLEI